MAYTINNYNLYTINKYSIHYNKYSIYYKPEDQWPYKRLPNIWANISTTHTKPV